MIYSQILLFTFGIWGAFISYQALRHNRLYWSYPSFSGFKERKEPDGPRLLCVFAGILSGALSLFCIFLAVRGFID
jgi:hypothetical protein